MKAKLKWEMKPVKCIYLSNYNRNLLMQLNIPIQEEKQKVKLQVSEKKRPDYL